MLRQYYVTRAVFKSSGKVKRCVPSQCTLRHFQDMPLEVNARGLSMLFYTDRKRPFLNSSISFCSRNQSTIFNERSTAFPEDDTDLSDSSGEGEDDVHENYQHNSDQELGVNSFTKRSHTCGELNLNHVGETVSLYGWIEAKRGDNFIILYDAYGSVQICLADSKELLDSTVPVQSVISVHGKVVERSPDTINKEMATGQIEVIPSEIRVLSTVKKSLPFSLKGHNKPKENLALKHRYLSLRFPEVQQALRIRSSVLHRMRRFLVEECSFVEVETPTLFGKTPGGAQEFVVPTRNKGKCYSLVQSPQQFKQMLMVGGMDRYFQVARCYRDEGSRADRQPEFTQLDIEVSFADMDDIMNLTEQILQHSWPTAECGLEPLSLPIPRMKYSDAILRYGTDAPDLRYSAMIDCYTNALTAFLSPRELNTLRILRFPGQAESYTGELSEAIEQFIQTIRSEEEGLAIKVIPYTHGSSLALELSTLFHEKLLAKLTDVFHGKFGDLAILAFGKDESVANALGRIRVPVSKMLGIKEHASLAPVWVTHFPLFKKGPRIGKLASVHHPFTAISAAGRRLVYSYPIALESLSYDLVINGMEIGGGSERIRDPGFQKLVLERIEADPASLNYFINALSSGCPPHAGIALGIDRLLACLLNRDSIRDVIAFPKTFDGVEPLTGAPKTPSDYDKKRYGLK